MKRFISLFLGVILIFAVVGCSSKNEWQEHFDLGTRYLNEGNYEEAIIEFTAAIEIDAKRYDAYEKRADAYKKQGDIYFSNGEYELAQNMYQLALTDYEYAVSNDNSISKSAINSIKEKIQNIENNSFYIKIKDIKYDGFDDIADISYYYNDEIEFMVTVEYKCPKDRSCLLMIGANTNEPESYLMSDNVVEVSSQGVTTISLTTIPIEWEGSQFEICVNLTDANNDNPLNLYASDIFVVDSEVIPKGYKVSPAKTDFSTTNFAVTATNSRKGSITVSDIDLDNCNSWTIYLFGDEWAYCADDLIDGEIPQGVVSTLVMRKAEEGTWWISTPGDANIQYSSNSINLEFAVSDYFPFDYSKIKRYVVRIDHTLESGKCNDIRIYDVGGKNGI